MRNIIVISFVIFSFSITCWSQAYYEASGQTAVFTLTAGAKAGPTAIKRSPEVHAALSSDIKVTMSRGGIVVIMPVAHQRSANIALYDIRGRQVYRQQGYNGTSLQLETKAFAPGIYNLLIRADGQSYTRRVAVYGRGE